jgi:methylisocitrate lyase
METRRAGRFRRDPATAYAVKTPHKTAQLRSAISAGCIVMPGAFNAATARLIERIGFPAVYVSGAGLANATAGVPDIGLLTLTEVAHSPATSPGR